MKLPYFPNMKEKTKLFKDLVVNDLKARYSGSALGIIWAFVQPMVTVLVFWYVFQIGFRNPPIGNVPFILWFVAGFIPWTFFNDAVMSSASVFYEYSFLVKKMKFRVSLLPIIKVVASFVIHFCFIIFVLVMYLLYGFRPNAAWLSVFYYSFCLFVLALGIAYFVSSVSVFVKDATQLVGIVLQLLFWMTPVFWSADNLKPEILRIIKLNPLYYIIDGYRCALIYNQPVFDRWKFMNLYFWGVTIIILVIGFRSFRSLKIHFADLL